MDLQSHWGQLCHLMPTWWSNLPHGEKKYGSFMHNLSRDLPLWRHAMASLFPRFGHAKLLLMGGGDLQGHVWNMTWRNSAHHDRVYMTQRNALEMEGHAFVLKSSIFWDYTSKCPIMLCSALKVNQRFRETCYLHLQNLKNLRINQNCHEVACKQSSAC
jgi:hypothetical protein